MRGQHTDRPTSPASAPEAPDHAAASEAAAKPAVHRISDATLLQAARECVLAHGVRRSTLTGIARRAGVSRMTLYRRFPDVHSMVAALMTEEFAETLRKAHAAAGTGTARTRLVTATIRCVRMLQSDPLLQRVLDTDAEMLLPYLVERLGSAQLAAERFVHEYLYEGHADGSIRRTDTATQARTLVLIAQSFVISAAPAATGVDPRNLSAELAHSLDSALHPSIPTAQDRGGQEHTSAGPAENTAAEEAR
ncbi:TetR family transcriptional regulator [Halopolyspora algeriensis]|uniref:TetR family transcriptional regulator n=1 Tax=Halopolyspora algeriensis TaxID=1500506 RepID=A0A368VW53_9ACTN|nr:TetR family transcriptional regulator [Halopolyspora algeriensis]TQM47574.1 TetR family transcriptional regulator [Halopolyspora algeriensis]